MSDWYQIHEEQYEIDHEESSDESYELDDLDKDIRQPGENSEPSDGGDAVHRDPDQEGQKKKRSFEWGEIEYEPKLYVPKIGQFGVDLSLKFELLFWQISEDVTITMSDRLAQFHEYAATKERERIQKREDHFKAAEEAKKKRGPWDVVVKALKWVGTIGAVAVAGAMALTGVGAPVAVGILSVTAAFGVFTTVDSEFNGGKFYGKMIEFLAKPLAKIMKPEVAAMIVNAAITLGMIVASYYAVSTIMTKISSMNNLTYTQKVEKMAKIGDTIEASTMVVDTVNSGFELYLSIVVGRLEMRAKSFAADAQFLSLVSQHIRENQELLQETMGRLASESLSAVQTWQELSEQESGLLDVLVFEVA